MEAGRTDAATALRCGTVTDKSICLYFSANCAMDEPNSPANAYRLFRFSALALSALRPIF